MRCTGESIDRSLLTLTLDSLVEDSAVINESFSIPEEQYDLKFLIVLVMCVLKSKLHHLRERSTWHVSFVMA